MKKEFVRTYRLVAAACVVVVVACALFVAVPAHAATRDELDERYQIAVTNYEFTMSKQSKNDRAIAEAEHEIARVQVQAERAQEIADEAAVDLYKLSNSQGSVLEMLLGSESVNDAVNRYESYKRIEERYAKSLAAARAKKEELRVMTEHLEARKAAIQAELDHAKKDLDDAEAALRDIDHSDGAEYHQVQGNGSNCGATSFIVGVNVLLHESRYKDNVAVWEAPGFSGNSTSGIAFKGGKWLEDNGLGDEIAIESAQGDIHTADQLREELEQGRVVVISSGPASTWQRADGTTAEEGSFPDGHFILFYHYEDGVFYANDSSVAKEKGAGCPYTEEQMQQWLDGRSTHFAVVMYKK